MKILKIDRSNPFDPAEVLGYGWSIVEQDQRSLALAEVDVDKILLPVYDASRRQFPQILLDAQIAMTFWQNPDFVPEAWKKVELGYSTRIYFEGTDLRHEREGNGQIFLLWENNALHFACNHQSRCFSFCPAAVLKI